MLLRERPGLLAVGCLEHPVTHGLDVLADEGEHTRLIVGDEDDGNTFSCHAVDRSVLDQAAFVRLEYGCPQQVNRNRDRKPFGVKIAWRLKTEGGTGPRSLARVDELRDRANFRTGLVRPRKELATALFTPKAA